eukprot:803867-Amphidinium_carterae.1
MWINITGALQLSLRLATSLVASYGSNGKEENIILPHSHAPQRKKGSYGETSFQCVTDFNYWIPPRDIASFQSKDVECL